MKSAIPVESLVERQRAFFNSGATRPVSFRLTQLKKLRSSILAHEAEILKAVHADLGKSDFEAFTTEIVLVLDEIKLMLRKCRAWSKPERRKAGLFNFPSKAFAYKDPHGVCLIMSPWNYPFQLSLMPLIGAIAAGNTAILKPSAYSGATSSLIARIVGQTFPPEYLAVVEGGRDVNQSLLEQHFDYIFFTGSVEVGKLVMERASRFLTPVTLELGGKSPCIIDTSADLDLAARRSVWGKCLNSGQTCIAPDYFLVHESVKDEFVARMKQYIRKFYGEAPHSNPEFPHIINKHHFDRLSVLIAEAESRRADGTAARLVRMGNSDADTLKIAPVIIDGAVWEDNIMKEEIFGPILPIITWKDEADITARIVSRPRPLALYLFTRDKAQQGRIFASIPFGGGCVNDTVMHISTSDLPFGGTGESGMGGYHGKHSFEAFSRRKSIIDKSLQIDVPLRYAPFAGKYRSFRKFLG